MAVTPLVAHATTARARAGLSNDPALVAATAADLNLAKTVAAIDRAGLTPEQHERIAVALLSDNVRAWLDRTLATAPKNLTVDQRQKITRILASAK